MKEWTNMKNIIGIKASGGIAISKVFKFDETIINVTTEKISDTKAEIIRLKNALESTKKDLLKIKSKTMENLGKEESFIIDAHIEMVADPEIMAQTIQNIEVASVNAAFAYNKVINGYIQIFEKFDNIYFKERVADILDIRKRVLCYLLNIDARDISTIDEEVIIFSHDLTPSDTAVLNKQFVKGFVTTIGGKTSHSAIMARSLEIPAVVGTNDNFEKINNNDIVIIDADAGVVIHNPSDEVIYEYEQLIIKNNDFKRSLIKYKDLPAETFDGHTVEIMANIGTPKDTDVAIYNGARGVGLYRTEFLYMDRDKLPTEDEQFEAYKIVLEVMKNQQVVVRTLDIGGDKDLPYLDLPHELNPFLGYRALRISLDRTDLFKTQLRALLRASIYGKLAIMFPMVATLDELRQAKKFLNEVEKELRAEGVEISENFQIGMMIEVPSAAILADMFAKEVDFFSIGTNDLIQYTVAADRMSDKVSYLYQPYNPSILRLINMVTKAAEKEGIPVGICGEMGCDALAIPLLIGLGVNKLSMSSSEILASIREVKQLSYQESKKLAEKALNKSSSDEVINLVRKFLQKKVHNS